MSRSRRLPAIASAALLGLLPAAAMTGCGGGGSQVATGGSAKRPPASKVLVDAGRLVDVGDGRSLYLKCVGSGSPTVVLEAGFGGSTSAWNAVQPQLGRQTRTCAYDRAGLGNSLPIPGVHDAGDEIADLRQLLERAKLPPPYVLVGHSYGGLLVRVFAAAHPGETAGVVLVDAMGRDQDRRLLELWRAAPAAVRRRVPKPTAEPVVEGVDLRASEALESTVRTLSRTPLVVITRGRPDPQEAQLPPRSRRAVRKLWLRMQDELAALSANHVHVIAIRSGHFMQGFAEGQPGVVIRGVRAVVNAARRQTELPACLRVFEGGAVRCRS
jgi:pimeloyl-ACP methyl ester carboxylesterase